MALLNKRLLLRGIPARYTAIQYALLDPTTAQLHLSSARMPGPILLRTGECRVLKVAGIPPGLFPEINYDHLTLQLEPGDSLLFYTDGLTDARNCQQAEFEAEGLQQVCGSHKGKLTPGIAWPHLLHHPEIHGRLPAIRRYDRRDSALFGQLIQNSTFARASRP
jgi:sigma-B regulation protein RsbU (phosphoserine phosphatase)